MEIRRRDLRSRRLMVGHTQASLASAVGVSISTLSRWERGTATPSARQRKRLCRELRVDEVKLDRLLGLAEPTPEPLLPSWIPNYELWVEEAGWLDEVVIGVMPWLLQTKTYAEASESMMPRRPSARRAATVKARMARQEALFRTEAPLHFQALISEGVLWDRVAEPVVMSAQMTYLATASAQHPNIDIRIMPRSTGISTAAVSGFQLLYHAGKADPFVAVTFHMGGAEYNDDGDDIHAFHDHYRLLRDGALTTEGSISLLMDMAQLHQDR